VLVQRLDGGGIVGPGQQVAALAVAQDDDLDDPPAVGAARPRTRAGDE
jgi:hypothetical protein